MNGASLVKKPETSDPAGAPADDAAPKVGSVSAALAILRVLGRDGSPRGVTAIARELSLSPSSCFNILKTLVSEGFVDFDSDRKHYSLGLGVLTVARRVLDPAAVFPQLRDKLETLAIRYSVTSGLWRLSGDRFVLTGYAESDNENRILLTVGKRLPVLAGASGRCVTAFNELDAKAVRSEFAKVRWANPPTFGNYMSQVETTREKGWALDRNSYNQGLTVIAVPIFQEQRHVRYCICHTMFSGQYDDTAIEKIADDTMAVAAFASSLLFEPVLDHR